MSVPPVDHACWPRLIANQVAAFDTSHVALKFLLKRLRGESTPPLTRARELQAFFVKYERLLGAEIRLLQR